MNLPFSLYAHRRDEKNGHMGEIFASACSARLENSIAKSVSKVNALHPVREE
jgi:hypothetical protein